MLGGGSVYRRRALEEIGGFPVGMIGEDAGATIAITGNGWRTRFVRDAVVDNRVVGDVRAYWHQHVRWARTGYETVHLQRGSNASTGRKLEAWMVSAGYSDRIALLAGVALAAAGALPVWVPVGYLGVIGLAVVVAVARGGELRRLPLYLLSLATMLLVDAAATLYAGALQLRRRPLHWRASRGDPGAGP
jgi:cellulose synthase/poly-beta-1,6-N-acetylglucosamine synthase-like glycosyltransferase